MLDRCATAASSERRSAVTSATSSSATACSTSPRCACASSPRCEFRECSLRRGRPLRRRARVGAVRGLRSHRRGSLGRDVRPVRAASAASCRGIRGIEALARRAHPARRAPADHAAARGRARHHRDRVAGRAVCCASRQCSRLALLETGGTMADADVRLHHRRGRIGRVCARQPAERRRVEPGARPRGGPDGLEVGHLHPHAGRADLADRQPLLRLEVRVGARAAHERPQGLPRARQGARRLELDQRDDLPARQPARHRALGARPRHGVVGLRALPAVLQEDGDVPGGRRRVPRRRRARCSSSAARPRTRSSRRSSRPPSRPATRSRATSTATARRASRPSTATSAAAGG